MGVRDIVCYVRRNGQCLDTYMLEDPIDEQENNLDQPYHRVIEMSDPDECNGECGTSTAMVIVHAYLESISDDHIRSNFFLNPLSATIYPDTEYSWDDWKYKVNGRTIDLGESMSYNDQMDSDESSVFKILDDWTDSNDRLEGNQYWYVAICDQSLEYIIRTDKEDVPIFLLEEIRSEWYIEISDSNTKREAICIIRDYFVNVRNYLLAAKNL